MVAIKVLPNELSRKLGLRQRFEREARAIPSLNVPHICALYDVGLQDGVDFLVPEYLKGKTLADRARSRADAPAKDLKEVGDPKCVGNALAGQQIRGRAIP